MKRTDKRFWKFEAAMLLCGVATVCVEALNYRISLFYLIGQLLIYPLCFCIGGVATFIITYRPDWNKVYPYRFCF